MYRQRAPPAARRRNTGSLAGNRTSLFAPHPRMGSKLGIDPVEAAHCHGHGESLAFRLMESPRSDSGAILGKNRRFASSELRYGGVSDRPPPNSRA